MILGVGIGFITYYSLYINRTTTYRSHVNSVGLYECSALLKNANNYHICLILELNDGIT
jgi:hypothetical protein